MTRAQKSNCLIKQRIFIQELIDDEDLGPRLEIEYLAEPGGSITFEDIAEDLINTSKIILKLAFSWFGETRAYGVTLVNGVAEWEEIQVTNNYWM